MFSAKARAFSWLDLRVPERPEPSDEPTMVSIPNRLTVLADAAAKASANLIRSFLAFPFFLRQEDTSSIFLLRSSSAKECPFLFTFLRQSALEYLLLVIVNFGNNGEKAIASCFMDPLLPFPSCSLVGYLE